MKFFTFFFLATAFIANAQISQFQAPLDSQFITQKAKDGYIHAPYASTHLESAEITCSLLPASYDLRNHKNTNYLSKVKDQGIYRSCWSFATYAAIESYWKLLGDSSFVDLSEAHMVKTHGFEGGINNDGSEQIATAYLSRLSGPVYESVEPYSQIASSQNPTINRQQDIPFYVDNIYWLGNSPKLVKKMIMKHGPVATNMNSSINIAYYNYNDHTFFYNGSGGINHGVTIVGWDDNKIVKGGFSATPEKPGAWIVRNSWGETNNTDDHGYFYASYEDKFIGKSGGICVGRTTINDIDTLFDNAKLGATTAFKVGDELNKTAYAAVRYSTNEDILVTDIGTTVFDEGTSVEYTICREFDGHHFTDTIQQSAYTLDLAGYHKTKSKVHISQGDFYVIARYQTRNSYYPLPAEAYIEDYAHPTIETDRQWVSANGKDWEKSGLETDYSFDLAIKVYAQYKKEVNIDFSIPKQIIVNESVTFANETMGEVDSFLWCINDDTITITDLSPLEYIFLNEGNYSLTLIAFSNSSIIAKSTTISCLSGISPSIVATHVSNYYSRHDSVFMNAIGATDYQWYIADKLQTSTSFFAFKPIEDTTAVILKGQTNLHIAFDTMTIVLANAPYDDIEEAGRLNLGEKIENLSFEKASLQSHELCPTASYTNTSLERCLTNTKSLWFSFEAPATGAVSVEIKGLFSSLSLYEAKHNALDIISGDTSAFQLIATNDYQDISDLTTRITELQGLEPSRNYWLQINGYKAKVKDNYLIVKQEESATINSFQAQQLEIINMPSLFSIKEATNCNIKIYNINGQEVCATTQNYTPTESIKPGLHLIHIETNNGAYTYKSIINSDWELEIITK